MLYSKFSTPSLAFAHMKQARLPFVHLSVVFLNEAAGFTLCYGLLICSHSFELLCHRASTLGFLHQLPVSYEVTWLLPRLDFHQLAINGLLGTLQRETCTREVCCTFLFRYAGAALCDPAARCSALSSRKSHLVKKLGRVIPLTLMDARSLPLLPKCSEYPDH
ncbi:hypothetical protein BBOR36S_02266 [Brevibacillus borstelensis]